MSFELYGGVYGPYYQRPGTLDVIGNLFNSNTESLNVEITLFNHE